MSKRYIPPFILLVVGSVVWIASALRAFEYLYTQYQNPAASKMILQILQHPVTSPLIIVIGINRMVWVVFWVKAPANPRDFRWDSFEQVYFRKNGLGPYCPRCLDKDHKAIRLMRQHYLEEGMSDMNVWMSKTCGQWWQNKDNTISLNRGA